MNFHSSKYFSKKLTIDGETFDSKKEYQRWTELQLLQKMGEISELRRQVKFELLPSQRVDGKVVERACTYNADFTYMWGGQLVVEDVKSPVTKTKDYIIKRKLMLYIHGIRIREVE